jgi:hypothetical protein
MYRGQPPLGFATFCLPKVRRKQTPTSNACETLDSQIKRRTTKPTLSRS